MFYDYITTFPEPCFRTEPDHPTRRPALAQASGGHVFVQRAATPRGDAESFVDHWLSLIDRGLIGNNPPEPPEPPHVAAQREANDALFRRAANPHAWEPRR